MREIFFYIILYPLITFGYFFSTNNLIILEHNTYTIGYNTNTHQASWVEYTLTSNELCATSKFKRTDDFRIDPLLTNENCFLVRPSHYNKSGYDKGHLCSAQDRAYSKEATSETFYMSNMSPQDPGFNRGIWKKLEEWTRNYAITNGYPVTVITGPIIFQKHFHMSTCTNICVPNMYYKILLTEIQMDTYCITNEISFLIPNEKLDRNVLDYKVNLNFILNFAEK